MQPESSRQAAVTAIANFSDVSFIDILDFQSKAIYSKSGPFRPATTPPSLPTLSPKLTRIPELASSSCTAAALLCLFCLKCLSSRAFSGNNVPGRPDHRHSCHGGAANGQRFTGLSGKVCQTRILGAIPIFASEPTRFCETLELRHWLKLCFKSGAVHVFGVCPQRIFPEKGHH